MREMLQDLYYVPAKKSKLGKYKPYLRYLTELTPNKIFKIDKNEVIKVPKVHNPKPISVIWEKMSEVITEKEYPPLKWPNVNNVPPDSNFCLVYYTKICPDDPLRIFH